MQHHNEMECLIGQLQVVGIVSAVSAKQVPPTQSQFNPKKEKNIWSWDPHGKTKKSRIMGTHAFDCAAGLLQVQQMEKKIYFGMIEKVIAPNKYFFLCMANCLFQKKQTCEIQT